MFQRLSKSLLILCGLLAFTSDVNGQRVRFGSSSSTSPPPLTGTPTTSVGQTPALISVDRPTTQMAPISAQSPNFSQAQGGAPPFAAPSSTQGQFVPPPQAPGISNPNASLQSPQFDPYATQAPMTQPPVVSSPNGSMGTYPGTYPGVYPGVYPGANGQSAPYPAANAQPYFAPNQNLPGYGGYTGQPSSMFPNWQPSGIAWPYAPGVQGQYLRLFEDLRLSETWVNGNNGADVDINDVALAVTMNYPDFLRSNQPLKITPGFTFHFWNGPSDPDSGADLPSKAYSTFLQFDWTTRQDVQLGGEIDFAVGVYTDFQSVTTDAVRFTGTGLGWLRVTPNLTMKLGVEYLDRVDLKLFPAGGIFWKPNPDLSLDLYFPRPRIARRLPQLGNTDIWWYLGAEYGGGSWVIERTDKSSDQVDINDIRVFTGLEWTTLSAFKGFADVGYVFNRELVYRNSPQDNLELSDTFMIRAGFAF